MNKKHNQIKKKLKITGITLIAIGAICTVIGIADFFIAFGSESMPKLFFMAFIGIPLLGVGISITSFAYKKEITTYVKNESVPVINEASSELNPAIKNITKSVKDGLTGKDTITCSCGEVNDSGSKYCKSCGKELTKVCPNCGKEIDIDSKFCNYCGKKLD